MLVDERVWPEGWFRGSFKFLCLLDVKFIVEIQTTK